MNVEWAKECGQPVAGKGKDIDSSQELPERSAALLFLYFSLVRPVSGF